MPRLTATRPSADRGHVEVALAAAVLGEELPTDRTPGDALLPVGEFAVRLEGAELTAAKVRGLGRGLPVAASAVPVRRGEELVKVAGAGAVSVDVGEPATQLWISLLHSLGSVNVGTGHGTTAFRPPAHGARD